LLKAQFLVINPKNGLIKTPMEFKSQVLRTISPKEGPKTLKAKSTCLGRGEHELELDLGLDGGGRR
jgi:hypothetical protein